MNIKILFIFNIILDSFKNKYKLLALGTASAVADKGLDSYLPSDTI